MATINKWYNAICYSHRLDLIPDAVQDFESELAIARTEVAIKGSLEQASSRLPGYFEYRYSQLQEIEGIVRYLEINLKKIKAERIDHYMTKLNRTLTYNEASKMVDGDQQYVDFTFFVSHFTLIRDQFAGICKSFDMKNWQLSNLTKMRVAGVEDASF